ncbi:hypothetical protein Tco_1238165 [Tanacetum coccineum]
MDTDCRLFLVAGLFYAILGQMTYPVASPTLDSAGSYVMQGAPFTQGTIPSIPIGGSISPEGFLPSILLLVFPLFATGISLGPVFLLGLSAFAMVAACASRAAVIPSVMSCWMAAKVMAGVSDVDVLLGGILST